MNPFQLVYNVLYNMMAEREDFKNLVRVGNRIRFDNDEDRDPIKLEVSSTDLPEVVLISLGTVDVNLYATSHTTSIVRNYSWNISTGDFRINQLFDVEWAVFCGMLDWQKKVTELTWCDQSFVKRCNFTEVTNGFSDPEANRNIMGWSAIWACEVEMHFVTKDLRDGCP